ncbi:MAG: aminopeptidase P family N-terminal domain-containing protein [Desulfobacterales bacterium]|nr:aminopeptidase P family N-terminal domain-containing protein [Desulfobacterales bacterium]
MRTAPSGRPSRPSGSLALKSSAAPPRSRHSSAEPGIDGLFIVQRVDLFYFSGTAQNGFLYLPAEGKPLLFIKQSVARARAESALETIVAIDSVKDRSGPDRRCLRPAAGSASALELDVLPVNEFRFYRGSFQAEGVPRRLAAHPPASAASSPPGRSPSSKRPPK